MVLTQANQIEVVIYSWTASSFVFCLRSKPWRTARVGVCSGMCNSPRKHVRYVSAQYDYVYNSLLMFCNCMHAISNEMAACEAIPSSTGE